jgi:hypothetical protein
MQRPSTLTNEENIKLMVQELDGDGLGRFAVNTISSLLMKPKGWTKPVINVPYPAGVPPKSLMVKIADASYEVSPPKEIDGWVLLKATRTLKFYKKGKVILVGIRGTADGRDFRADLKIIKSRLDKSARYKQDLEVLTKVYNENSGDTFYGVGHSLGGAILDLFLQTGMISKGISYNPAVEKPFFNSTKNYRIYMENDPLYNFIGQYTRLGEVRKQPAVSRNDAVGAVQSVKAHLLSNFEGGSMRGGAPTPPEVNEIMNIAQAQGVALDRIMVTRRVNQLRQQGLNHEQIIVRIIQEYDLFEGDAPQQNNNPPPMEGEGVIDTLKHILKPASKYNNLSTRTLKAYGECTIEKLVVMRTPLQSFVDKALKLISFGKFNPKKYGFDELFHTGLLVSVVCPDATRKVVVIEKNEVLNISTKFKINAKSQKMDIATPAKFKTLREFMDKAEQSVSPKVFYQYDPFKNNCQDFMKIVLTANGLYTPALGKFINQDLTKLVEDNAGVAKFSKGVTDLAGVISRVRGKGDEESMTEC